MSEEEFQTRLERVERVLGLQRLEAGDDGDELELAAAGNSTRSVHCKGNSSASLICAVDDAMLRNLRR